MDTLNDTERDALTELGNIGVAKASVALAKLVGGEVGMSVPDVRIMPRGAAARGLEDAFSAQLVAVSECFDGALAGAALLVFPERHCHELVRAVLPPEVDAADLPELEGEALAEVGNIVLNNWLAVVANMLDAKLNTALPTVLRGDGAAILAGCGVPVGDAAPTIVFTIRFHVHGTNIAGQILIAMDASAEAALRGRIAHTIKKITG
ncbi:MAG TPA: chemotaxis protein CheC [Azospirillum sp.]|nr:chemotaxis protein CheC [Azospirillum sp.]